VDCNKKAKRIEETNKVKRRFYFVKRKVLQMPNQVSRRFAQINADQKKLPRMNANRRESIICVHSRDWRQSLLLEPSGKQILVRTPRGGMARYESSGSFDFTSLLCREVSLRMTEGKVLVFLNS
jgi:hypothetical protein